jgi:hypothetical protein
MHQGPQPARRVANEHHPSVEKVVIVAAAAAIAIAAMAAIAAAVNLKIGGLSL